jgi:low temperature requirement protein LtrA
LSSVSEDLQSTYAASPANEDNELTNFQLQAIRELQSHHEGRRTSIREKHSDIYNEFEQIKSELDALSAELDLITDHHVTLDANFSKFGYSAHLRTIDIENPSFSGSESSGFSALSEDGKVAQQAGMNLKFWKRPVVRQYFHKGLLWRSKKSGEVAYFELFVDLLYVGVIATIGDTASESTTSAALLHYLITYTMSARMWADVTNMMNWFETGDVMQRLTIMLVLLCILGFTTNVANAFDSSYNAMVAFYLGERLLQGIYFLWVAAFVPTIRGVMVCHTGIILMTTAIWIASVHTQNPGRLALMIPAVLIDLFSSMTVTFVMRAMQKFSASESQKRFSNFMKRLATHFEFYPAINIEHRVERNNTFIALVFGYSVLAILYQNRFSVFASNSIFGKACLSLIQAFCFNWMYFEIDLLNMQVHAIRRHYFSAWIWIFGHLPFVMGYTLAATAMSKIVLAHDHSNADEESLGEPYDSKSLAEVSTGLRWFYCGGLCVALVFSCIISLSHIYNISSGSRLTRESRLIVRFASAIAVLLLPLVPKDRLQSLALIGITCSIIIGCLIVDLYGLSQKGGDFWFGGFSHSEKKNTSYAAHCALDEEHKSTIKRNLEMGHHTTIKDLLRRSSLGRKGNGVFHWNDHHNADTHIANV